MSFKGVKKYYLKKRKNLLKTNKKLKNLLAKIRKELIKKAVVFRAVYYIVLQNKKNIDVCQQYDEIEHLQRLLLAMFEKINNNLQFVDLNVLFSNILQNEKLVWKELRQFYNKSVREMLRI